MNNQTNEYRNNKLLIDNLSRQFRIVGHLKTSGRAPGESPSKAVHPVGGGSAAVGAPKPPLTAGGRYDDG